MRAAVREIWGERVPKSGFELANGPDIEAYPPGFEHDRLQPRRVVDSGSKLASSADRPRLVRRHRRAERSSSHGRPPSRPSSPRRDPGRRGWPGDGLAVLALDLDHEEKPPAHGARARPRWSRRLRCPFPRPPAPVPCPGRATPSSKLRIRSESRVKRAITPGRGSVRRSSRRRCGSAAPPGRRWPGSAAALCRRAPLLWRG